MATASGLFYSPGSDQETLYSRIVPTDEQTTFLREKWNALADWLVEDLSSRSGLPIRTWLQGSYKFGTVIRPIGPSGEYDVDLGVYFCWAEGESSSPTPEQLRSWVQDSLLAFSAGDGSDIKSVARPPKERCSRAHYEQQFHIDLPTYHLDEPQDTRRLATVTKGWEDSDPKAIYVWFKDKVENPDRAQLRRIVRYLKAWAAITFKDDVESRPSSILLTVLATEAFLEFADANLDEEDAFCMAVKHIAARLAVSTQVLNPVDSQEDINRCKDAALERLVDQLNRLDDIGDRAVASESDAAAAVVWDEAFSHLFPLPQDGESVEYLEANGQAVAVLPIVDVDVQEPNGRRIRTFRDAVPSVDKGKSLRFRIANPEVVPRWATVDWVVRNEGDDAARKNDLGHAKRGARDLECSERTAYNGRHFMDCIIRDNGHAIAVKRIPVYIRSQSFTKALPERRWFRKYVRRRR